MGRPLRQDTIIAMSLTTEQGSKLGKQVGFNKYLEFKGLDENKEPIYVADKIICLSNKADIVNDINYEVLNLNVNGEAKPVTKILKNLVLTADGVFAYKLETKEVDGKKVTNVVFADANVSLGTSTEETKVEETVVEEEVVETVEEDGTETEVVEE